MKSFLKLESNSRVYRMMKRRCDLSCSYCPPNRNENQRWCRRYSVKKAYQLDPKRRH